MREAEKWTQQMFRSWGLDVHADPFEFGRGWWIESAHTRMVTPRPLELRSIPIAWTPATKGNVSADVVVAPIRSVRDLEKWKGKLKGKIVLVNYPEPPKDDLTPAFHRLDDAEIGKLNTYRQPSYDPERPDMLKHYLELGKTMNQFMAAEGAVALVHMSRAGNGLLHGEGRFYKVGETPALPEIEMAAEDYRRLARLAKTSPVKLEINSNVHFDDRDVNGYNILADIPGSDPKAGYVMAGAHLDSWVAGDGASDNGAGSVVVMEAARILSALHVKPKRAIRFALWSGEEQGLIGSSAYVAHYLAKRPVSKDPELAKLLAQIRPGDTLVVWRLDRLGRSTAHLIQTVSELGDRGIGFRSLSEAIDTTTSAGRLLFGILASLAAFERDLIRERTIAGLTAARARGNLGGRPATMTPEKLAVARRMLAEGTAKAVVAQTIGVSRPTLYAHLNRTAAQFLIEHTNELSRHVRHISPKCESPLWTIFAIR